MGTGDTTNGTIGGSQIVKSYPGSWTGDKIHHTADGRVWEQSRGNVVSNSLPTGVRIEAIRYQ